MSPLSGSRCMMFDPNKLLELPIYELTPAARMALTGLELSGIVAEQRRLQIQHMNMVRQAALSLTGQEGALLITNGPYCICVIDSILPDDYQRRTVICMGTELEDIRIKMFRASGLIPTNKKD
jgi:hypothetical protein